MKEQSKRQFGGTILEATYTLPVVLLVLFAGIQLMLMAWQTVTTQYVISRAVQRAAVGMCRGPIAYNPSPYYAATEDDICPAVAGTTQQKQAEYAYWYAVGFAARLGVNLRDVAPGNPFGLKEATVCVAKFDTNFASATCTPGNKTFLGAQDGEILGMLLISESAFGNIIPKRFGFRHTVTGFALSVVN